MRKITRELRIVERARNKYVRGMLYLVILASLRNKEMSGYDMIGLIHKTFDLLLSAGTFYPILKSMEQEGLIRRTRSGGKRLYRLTEKGKSLYQSLLLEYEKIVSKFSFLCHSDSR